MNIFNVLERKFGRFVPQNITNFLIAGQALIFILIYTNRSYIQLFILQGDHVLKGELWRVLTMLFLPLSQDPLFAVLTLYLYYIFGTTLEREWGSFRYLVFILIAYIATVASSFLFPKEAITNRYIFTSIFLAFAYSYPNFRLYVLFIIPVKIKWFALLIWLGLVSTFILGSVSTKILIFVSIANFFLFFGKDIFATIKYQMRKTPQQSFYKNEYEELSHMCSICKTSKGEQIVYYCKICMPDSYYCEMHINKHIHKS